MGALIAIKNKTIVAKGQAQVAIQDTIRRVKKKALVTIKRKIRVVKRESAGSNSKHRKGTISKT